MELEGDFTAEIKFFNQCGWLLLRNKKIFLNPCRDSAPKEQSYIFKKKSASEQNLWNNQY